MMRFIIVVIHLVLSPVSSQNSCHQITCGTGRCVETENPILPYYCQCPNGSNSVLPCSSMNPCSSNPCGAGVCDVLHNSPNGYLCQCPDHSLSFVGCNENPSGCFPSPCANGVCRENQTGVYCECLNQWSGPTCEIKQITPCQSDVCAPGRCFTINDDLVTFVCLCPDGRFAQSCINSTLTKTTCQSFGCANNGTCLFTPRGYQCLCTNGFTGLFCDTNINECASNPCNYGGICHDLISSYVCSCPDGTSGPECFPPVVVEDVRSVECPCLNGGICPFLGAQYCLCPNGYTGAMCQDRIVKVTSTCENIICLNGGQCEPSTNLCQCAPGFLGPNCEKEYFRCPSNGRFTDRFNCALGKYFECVHDNGNEQSNLHGILLSRQCPSALRFNVLVDRCDYAENVHCQDF